MATLPSPPPASPSPNTEPYYIFVLGAPGAGKGTLCKRLALENGFYHLSVGDYLREICTNKSPLSLAMKIDHYVRSETLIPDELMKKIVSDEMLPMVRSKNTPCVIIDGFPRSFEQIPKWGDGGPHMVLYFDCPKELAGERVVKRGRGGLSAEELAGIFERRYTQFQSEITKILECYALENPTLGPEPTIDAIAEFMVEVDTSRSTEESWAALQDKLAKNLRWKQIMEYAASNVGVSEGIKFEETDSLTTAGKHAGDVKKEEESDQKFEVYRDEDEEGNDADDEKDDEEENKESKLDGNGN